MKSTSLMPHRLKSAILLGIVTFTVVACSKQEKDTAQVEFEKNFLRDAILVKTCPGDPRYASGASAVATKVYRFEQALWYEDATGYRKVDATPERVCDAFVVSN
jgi:hypothetical protein